MNYNRIISAVCLAAALFPLSSCVPFIKRSEAGKVTEVSYVIDSAATILPARYGKSYLLEGNIVARYQDFDLFRSSSKTVASGHAKKLAGNYSIFEIRNREGKPLKRILLSPRRKGELMRFIIDGRSYHISHGKQDGAVIINIPQHQLA